MHAIRLSALAAALTTALAAHAGTQDADEVTALKARLARMEQEMSALRAELDTLTSHKPQHEAALQTLDARVAKVEQAAPAAAPAVKGHRVFFRGGSANLVEDRANGAFTDLLGLSGPNDDDDGWYFGAGFDFLLSRDTFGLLPNTWALAELGLEFRNLGSERTLMTGPTVGCLALGAPAGACLTWTGEEELLMLTVSAAPKLKFREGAKLRPWIIPAGLDINVISPPSDSTNYLDIGVQFGAGLDYEMLPGITIGADVRYHWAADLTDPEYSAAQAAAVAPLGVTLNREPENDAWTAGVSVGIAF